MHEAEEKNLGVRCICITNEETWFWFEVQDWSVQEAFQQKEVGNHFGFLVKQFEILPHVSCSERKQAINFVKKLQKEAMNYPFLASYYFVFHLILTVLFQNDNDWIRTVDLCGVRNNHSALYATPSPRPRAINFHPKCFGI